MLISVSIMINYILEYRASDLQGFLVFIITQLKGLAILHNKKKDNFFLLVLSFFFLL